MTLWTLYISYHTTSYHTCTCIPYKHYTASHGCRRCEHCILAIIPHLIIHTYIPYKHNTASHGCRLCEQLSYHILSYIHIKILHCITRLSTLWILCTWWSHQMEIFSALLAICAGNSPVTDKFPSQRPVTRSFDVLFYLRLNKRLNNLRRHRTHYNVTVMLAIIPHLIIHTCIPY